MILGRSVVIVVALAALFGPGIGHMMPSEAPTTGPVSSPSATPQSVPEEAYRANNLGVALMEQFKYKEAADAFMRALRIVPGLPIARVNLSIAFFNVPDIENALKEARSAISANPNVPQPYYIIGMIAKSQGRGEEAIAAFNHVLQIDPADVGANVNLGQVYAQQKRYREAIAAFRKALASEPYNATALYNLAITLTRAGERVEGQSLIQKFQKLRQSGAATTIGQSYLEQGRYAEAIASTGLEPGLVDHNTPAVTFTDATDAMFSSSGAPRNSPPISPSTIFGRRFEAANFGDATKTEIAASLGGNVTLFDYDGDGYLDMFVVTATEQRLYHNEHGKFVDVTAQSGALASKGAGVGIGAVAGDYDNDGRPDLFVIRSGSLSLYHNEGGGKFSDATHSAGIPAYPYLPSSVAFVDFDHDGNLDIFITGLADLSKPPKPTSPTQREVAFPDDFAGAPNLLLRNNANGKFSDVTAQAKVAGNLGHAVGLVPTDYDNTRDVDLLVLNYGKAPDLFSNQRDGSFRNVTREVGLDSEGRWTCVAAGDVNKDGFTDFFFGRADGPGVFAISDGKGHFNLSLRQRRIARLRYHLRLWSSSAAQCRRWLDQYD
jgi:Flp pilus assembly protein TadD